ncbi:hypothetical protein V5P93_003358 [Actinokineospora auranticolor]|uniref:MFS transporter n=1 Tax=Actinokineospora auranticolor TaxID=155976 RepID=A0A2S6GPB7_9PSEU|nr:hypothetical protein [Actinokineospora auranticolor]PPK67020.1 hypothetical protein CLV40_10816 [Actinokineospora auranticolor]
MTGAVQFLSVFLVLLFYQLVRDFDMLLAPLGVGWFADRLSDKVDTRALGSSGGAAIAAAALVLAQVEAGSGLVALAVCVLLTGLGLGFVGAPTMGSLYRALPAESTSRGTSALSIGRCRPVLPLCRYIPNALTDARDSTSRRSRRTKHEPHT